VSILSEIVLTTLDFIIPQRCLICNVEIEKNLLCRNCIDYMPEVNAPMCIKCGRPVKKKNTCIYCKTDSHIDHGRSWLLFISPVDSVIHHFKYRNKTKLSRFFGQAMTTIIRSDHVMKNADILTPVPLFWWKQLRRGYNQSQLLADSIASDCHIESRPLLKRVKNTRTQTKLSDTARRDNVSGAFTVTHQDVENKKVIVVDDVMTTGATINECARVLKQAGASEVYSCVAAITPV
jgi:competence protein ComFC